MRGGVVRIIPDTFFVTPAQDGVLEGESLGGEFGVLEVLYGRLEFDM